MKRKVLVGLLATVTLFAVLFGAKGITKVSAATDTELKIVGKNVSYGDSLYILFAVSSSNPEAEVKLLTWTEGTGVYDYGTQEKILTRDAKMKVGGQDCDVFYYPVAAKQMADTIYARAYTEVGGEAVYSEPAKMSVLEYAYNKLGYSGTKTTDAKLEALLKSMLTYGGNAQDYFTYNMDNQATAEQSFYKVEVEGGLLPDGFTYGLYKEGQEVVITVPEKDENGYQFNDWKDESGNIVGNTNVLEYEVAANKKLIAEYSQLAFIWQYDNEDHWKHYSLLDADSKHEPHGLKVFSDEDGHWTNCNICGYSSDKESHNYVTKYDAESHWEECEFCGKKKNATSHTLILNHNESAHWKECECGYRQKDEEHNYVADVCTVCGNEDIVILEYILLENDTYGVKAGKSAASQTTITIPSEHNGKAVTEILVKGFQNLQYLRTISIPNSVSIINQYAFDGCISLNNVILPESVRIIDKYCFSNCISMTSITLNNGLTTIGGYSFKNDDQLTTLSIPDSVSTIKAYALYGSSISSLEINTTVDGWMLLDSSITYVSGTVTMYTGYSANLEKYFNANGGFKMRSDNSKTSGYIESRWNWESAEGEKLSSNMTGGRMATLLRNQVTLPIIYWTDFDRWMKIGNYKVAYYKSDWIKK